MTATMDNYSEYKAIEEKDKNDRWMLDMQSKLYQLESRFNLLSDQIHKLNTLLLDVSREQRQCVCNVNKM